MPFRPSRCAPSRRGAARRRRPARPAGAPRAGRAAAARAGRRGPGEAALQETRTGEVDRHATAEDQARAAPVRSPERANRVLEADGGRREPDRQGHVGPGNALQRVLDTEASSCQRTRARRAHDRRACGDRGRPTVGTLRCGRDSLAAAVVVLHHDGLGYVSGGGDTSTSAVVISGRPGHGCRLWPPTRAPRFVTRRTRSTPEPRTAASRSRSPAAPRRTRRTSPA